MAFLHADQVRAGRKRRRRGRRTRPISISFVGRGSLLQKKGLLASTFTTFFSALSFARHSGDDWSADDVQLRNLFFYAEVVAK